MSIRQWEHVIGSFGLWFFIFISPQFLVAQVQIGSDIDGKSEGDWSGWSVAMSANGNRVAIGAPLNDDAGPDAGHVRIFDLSEGTWTQVGSDIGRYGNFGSSIAISADGSRIAVGAIGTHRGEVIVFDLIDGDWSQVGEVIFGGVQGQSFGISISMSASGDRLLVGDAYDDNAGRDVGQVWVFDLIDETWTQVGAGIDGNAIDGYFGTTTAISEDGNIIASGLNPVAIYKFEDSDWQQMGLELVGEEGTVFGASLSLSADGNRIAVGAIRANGSEEESGQVRVFDFQNGSWVKTGNDIIGEFQGDQFGFAVDLSASGNRLAISALASDHVGRDSGKVEVYDFIGGDWSQVGVDIPGEAQDDQSGFSISLSALGDRLSIGAPFNNGSGQSAGHVRIFELPDQLPVELVRFEGQLRDRELVLSWATASETENAGFIVEHVKPSQFDWSQIDFVGGAGTTTTEQNYSHEITGLTPGPHKFRLRQIDYDGGVNFSPILEIIVGLDDSHKLSRAYPNPFSIVTSFDLVLPRDQSIEIMVHDTTGRIVEVLYDEFLSANTTKTFHLSAEGLSNGIYVIRIQGENFVDSQKVLIVH